MKVGYDFHIHSIASPCGDERMTPNNIINLCTLLDKKVIAITDHNTCCNVETIKKLGEEKNILVIPGMELECMEEFHCITLFPTVEATKEVEKIIQNAMPKVKNKPTIFGHQWVMNEEDEVIGEIEQMLLVASQISIEELCPLVRSYGGIIYPAHIDRSSYSILSNLGTIPKELGFKTIELSKIAKMDEYMNQYKDYRIVTGSDAHYLEDLCEGEFFMDLSTYSQKDVFEWLNNC